MQKLYIGMPLLDLMSAMEDKYIKENFKENILNFCRQELENGDNKITNEIELSILQAWFNNEDKINMPELSLDKYALVNVFSEKKKNELKVYEKFAAQDSAYYTKCTTKNLDGEIIKTSISYKTSSFANIALSGGTEDYIMDNNNDGCANSRMIIKTNDGSVDILNDIDLDGKMD